VKEIKLHSRVELKNAWLIELGFKVHSDSQCEIIAHHQNFPALPAAGF
jgi:hypothetical protein